ncbi:hypothetical protein L596_016888 [Steinernema carpocapsae]|uniref:Mothers against decapentaplegic homolog n=1 Tax=Steinernema carpocapsae TaxID=34508 RepID=A0A4U5NJ88_STECR|nr:hypothetical protein L596_016888 [Steinernema carpocapsae]
MNYVNSQPPGLGSSAGGPPPSVPPDAASVSGFSMGGVPMSQIQPQPTSADPCTTISHFLMKFNMSAEEDFSKKAIDSLIKKLKDKREELDYLIVAVASRGNSPTKCVNIPRTLDGRLQVAGRKGFPHVVYSRIFRYSDLHKNELKHIPGCETAFDLKCESVCINPYHYERVPQGALASNALLAMPNLSMEGPPKDDRDRMVGSVQSPYGFPSPFEPPGHMPPGSIAPPGVPSTAGPSSMHSRPVGNSYHDSIKQLMEAPDDIPPDWRPLQSLQSLETPAVTPGVDLVHNVASPYGNFFDSAPINPYFAPIPYQQMPPLYDHPMMPPGMPPPQMMHSEFMSPADLAQLSLMEASPGMPPHMMPPSEPHMPSTTDPCTLDILTSAMSANMSLNSMTPKPKEEPLSPDPGPSSVMSSQPGPSRMNSQPGPSHVHREITRVKSEDLTRNTNSPPALKVPMAKNSAQVQYPELYSAGRYKQESPTGSQDEEDENNDPLYSMIQRCYSIPPNVERISELADPLSWAFVRYNEYAEEIGTPFEAFNTQIFIDAGTNPDHPHRFCLGQVTNPKRTPEIKRILESIGKGIRINVQGEGDVFLVNLSKQNVFVHSFQFDKTNQENNTDGVARVQPLSGIPVFTLKDFYDEIRNRDMLQQIGKAMNNKVLTVERAVELGQLGEKELVKSSEWKMDDFVKLCSIRVSFIKGWGPDYNRKSVSDCPVWIDIQVNRAMQLLDEVLRHPRVNF